MNLCNEACLSYKSLSEANSIFRIYDFQCKEVSKDPVQYRKILCTISKNRAKVCKWSKYLFSKIEGFVMLSKDLKLVIKHFLDSGDTEYDCELFACSVRKILRTTHICHTFSTSNRNSLKILIKKVKATIEECQIYD